MEKEKGIKEIFKSKKAEQNRNGCCMWLTPQAQLTGLWGHNLQNLKKKKNKNTQHTCLVLPTSSSFPSSPMGTGHWPMGGLPRSSVKPWKAQDTLKGDPWAPNERPGTARSTSQEPFNLTVPFWNGLEGHSHQADGTINLNFVLYLTYFTFPG